MVFSNERFLQNFLENEVKTGMLVVDGCAGNGQKTRFLASHVGSEGMVLSFHEEREEANKTAASLFMAGLQDRVTVENGRLSADALRQELGRLTKVDLLLLDYSQSTAVDRHTINDECESAWPFLKDGGQLILALPVTDNLSSIQRSVVTDFEGPFSAACFTAKDGATLLFEKESSKEETV
ncbi:class I SAM-dependent methyltransferase [Fructobacillus parabroussonetiae]|uniref:SAM-dependent methyltransferase n=1 Tax=Fructobacillus parabroussonetiae TaxID=2713174 RepID=A0ABS5R0L1_9LACO|nr:class I SAM-dependent methyltransferase [Fructobacillus parabroussonetiae]MBS9337692.1 hypothetical protein [Fructobacillus parabroussonetiae]